MEPVTSILEWTVRSAPLVGLALLGATALLRSAALRHATLTAALVTSLALPAIATLPLAPSVAFPAVDVRAVAERIQHEAEPVGSFALPGRAQEGGGSTFPWPRIGFLLWASGALILLARLAVGYVRARRILQRARTAADPLVARISAWGADPRRPPRVVVSGEVPSPFVTGILSSTVVLPREAVGWTRDRLDVVLRHELAHCRRRDNLWASLAHVARAAYWWNPLTWLAVRRLRLEAERAADEAVVREGVDPHRYVDEMVGLARQTLFRSRAPGMAAATAGTFERRMRSVLELTRRRRAPRPWHVATVAAPTVLLGIGLATVQPGLAALSGPWLSVSADGRSVRIHPDVAVRFTGSGGLAFEEGRRVVALPEGARVRVPGADDPRSMVIGRDVPGVEVMDGDGNVTWLLDLVDSVPEEPGTRILDTDAAATSRIDTAQPTLFYLEVRADGSTLFFHPATRP